MEKQGSNKSDYQTLYEFWTCEKSSLRYFHVWRCLIEVRPSRLNEKKLDSRIMSCYFIGYSKRSKRCMFYDPMAKLIFELGNAWLFEDIEFVEERYN